MELHKQAVAVIAANVRQFYDRKESFRIFHGSTNSTRPLSFHKHGYVDTSRLTHVLHIDRALKTVQVEPNVPMDELVKATLQYGLVPPVVMEFPGITVGGGFASTSGESSSFRHGFFDRTVNWVESVLANGKVLRASETENADLFHGAAGSFGTLGVTSLLELRLIEAKKYVELTYIPINSVSEAIRQLDEETASPSNDYVDGIMFSLDSGVVVTGKLTDSPPIDLKIQTFSCATDPWFYLHVQNLISQSSTPITEAVPMADYLFRYDRGAFWMGSYAFKYFGVPFNRVTRWLLDWFMHTRVMYHALHESGMAEEHIIQDLVLPRSQAESFIKYIDNEFGIYPLWLCPLRKTIGERSFHPHGSEDEMPLNIGVWGPYRGGWKRCIEANQKLELKLKELSGMKWLYAQVFYTEEEFWSLYDRPWYEALREKYDATTLPSVYEKVRTIADTKSSMRKALLRIRPIGGLYGVWRSFVGGNYLTPNKRSGFLIIAFILGILLALFISSTQWLLRNLT
jgi:delta24-sterol reductase